MGTEGASVVPNLIEREILPRLLVAHADDPSVGGAARKVLPTEVEEFAKLPLSHEVDDLLREVDTFLKRGATVESVYIDLLAPSARELGKFWEADTCDFVDVTMALWRLQEVMREVAARFPVQPTATSQARSALFSPLPGDQHSFGALMIEEVFSRAGWDSEALIEPQRAQMLQLLAERSFDLVGLTVSNDCPSAELSSLVAAIRSVSRCRTIKVLIGGPAINANPGLCSLVGADGTAADARSALILADRIVLESKRIDLRQS